MRAMTGAYKHFLANIPDEINTIWELGSRDCLDAILLSNHFNARVFAFECNPPAIEICKKNIEGRDNITLVEKAVWSEDTTLIFYPVVNGNLGASSCFVADSDYPFENYKQEQIEVEAIRLDNAGLPTPDMVCLDLQGAELEALKGMGDILHDVKWIITEGQVQRLYHDTPLISDIEEYLSQYGFSLTNERTEVKGWFGDYVFSRG